MCPLLGLFQSGREKQAVSRTLKPIIDAEILRRQGSEEKRADIRISLSLSVLVVPLRDDSVQLEEVFKAVTLDLSEKGVSFFINRPLSCESLLVGFEGESCLTFFRGIARHVTPIVSQIRQVGVELIAVAEPEEFPEIATLSFRS